MIRVATLRRTILALTCAVSVLIALPAIGEEPRREDIDDLIVLHLYGSYREMGRQQAELMGPELREAYEYAYANYIDLLSGAGPMGWFFNHINLPLVVATIPIGEDSGFHEELAGMASGLDVSHLNIFRAILSLANVRNPKTAGPVCEKNHNSDFCHIKC